MSVPGMRPVCLLRHVLTLALAAYVLVPAVADAHVEPLRWQHTDPSGIAAFRVYTRGPSGSYGAPVFEGLPAPDASGVYQFDLPMADGSTLVVAVTAVDAFSQESPLSNEKQVSAPAPPPPSSGAATYRINAGGFAYIDSNGAQWEDDTPYVSGGSVYYRSTLPIQNTADPDLYRSTRFESAPGQSLVYQLPVADGRYRVRLHLVEPWEDLVPGARIFDVVVEGALVHDDLDLYSSPGYYVPLVSETEVDVADGALEITLRPEVLYPLVAAIEVEPVAAGGGSGGTAGGGTPGGGTPGGGTGGGTTLGAPGQPVVAVP